MRTTEHELLLFIIEVVDLAPEEELTGRWGVLRAALCRYLVGAPLDEEGLRARLPPVVDRVPGGAEISPETNRGSR